MHEVEFAGTFAALPPRLHPVAVLVVFGYARIHVAVADVDVALRIPGHVGRLAEAAVDGRERRVGVALVRMRVEIGGFRFASEHLSTRPSGLNLITMSEPLSVAQMLSSLSTRTV